MTNFTLTIDGKYVSCLFRGTTRNGGLRLATGMQDVIMSKRMVDIWIEHPEINFHIQDITMHNGCIMTFLV